MGYPGRNFHYLASEGELGVAPSHSSPVSTNTEASLATEQQALLFLYCFKKYRSFSWNRAAATVRYKYKQEQNLFIEQRSSLCQILQKLHLK
jgi:hypothetical protein